MKKSEDVGLGSSSDAVPQSKCVVIPGSIQIGPYTVKIEQEHGFWHSEGTEGVYYPNKSKIIIDSELDPAKKVEVLIHEIIEAIIRSYDQKIDHTILVIISMGLTQAISQMLKTET